MSNKLDVVGLSGLQFFGQMTASISHEIKNVFAIVNENAGLLEDFCLMVEKGTPLDPKRLKTLAGKVVSQVWRGDSIINNLNQFAHSIDNLETQINLFEILELMVAISARLVSMRGLDLVLEQKSEKVNIINNQFILQNLMWRCLDFVMKAAGGGKTVTLAACQTANGAQIIFTILDGFTEMIRDEFPAKREQALIDMLESELTIDLKAGKIILDLPAAIQHK